MTPTSITGATDFYAPPVSRNFGAPAFPPFDLRRQARRDGDLFVSAWRPSAGELADLVDGGVVVLTVAGWQPPVALSVEPGGDDEPE